MNTRNHAGIRQFIAVVIGLPAMLLINATVNAALYVDARAYCTNATSSLGPCPDYQVIQTYNNYTYPFIGTPMASAANGFQGVQAEAYAIADYGVLKVSGHADSVGGIPNTLANIADSSSTAIMGDSITINSVGFERSTPALLTASFAVSGGYSRNGEFAIDPGAFDAYTAGTQGNWRVSIWNNYYSGSERGTLYQNGYEEILRGVNLNGAYDTTVQSIFGAFAIQVPILLGEMFDISMELGGRSYALTKGAGASSWSDYDLGHSAYWGGITSISVGGQEVPFSLDSLSGHDWIQSSIPSAVPVPAALWLFGSGLLGLAGVARPRQKDDSTTKL